MLIKEFKKTGLCPITEAINKHGIDFVRNAIYGGDERVAMINFIGSRQDHVQKNILSVLEKGII